MYLTEKLATTLGKKARIFLNVDKNKEQIIVYGAINLLQIIFSILFIIIIGLILGVLYEALIFSITVGILRKYSGGVHSSSPNLCIILGSTLTITASLIIDKFFYRFSFKTTLVINIFSIVIAFIIIILKAPVDSIQKPITNTNIKKSLKEASITTLFIFCVFTTLFFTLYKITPKTYYLKIIYSIMLGISWQCITLTKIGITIFEKIDFTLKCIIERR